MRHLLVMRKSQPTWQATSTTRASGNFFSYFDAALPDSDLLYGRPDIKMESRLSSYDILIVTSDPPARLQFAV